MGVSRSSPSLPDVLPALHCPAGGSKCGGAAWGRFLASGPNLGTTRTRGQGAGDSLHHELCVMGGAGAAVWPGGAVQPQREGSQDGGPQSAKPGQQAHSIFYTPVSSCQKGFYKGILIWGVFMITVLHAETHTVHKCLLHPIHSQSIGPLGRCFLSVEMSVCVSVCPCVRLSVCSLLRYSLNLILLALPKIGCFRDLESLGKSSGMKWSQVWTFWLKNGFKLSQRKKFFLRIFFICSLLRYCSNVFLPPLPKVGCPKMLAIRNSWEKYWKEVVLGLTIFSQKWSKIAAADKFFTFFFVFLHSI